jgi:hypothetical protein
MPVILTTDEEHCLAARTMGRSEGVRRALPDDVLKIEM